MVGRGDSCDCKCCGRTKEIPTIPESRVAGNTQVKCKLMFVIVTILLVLVVGLLIATLIDYHDVKYLYLSVFVSI